MLVIINSTQPVLQDCTTCVVHVKPQLYRTRKQDYSKESPHHLPGMKTKYPKAKSMLWRTVRTALELKKWYQRIQPTLSPKERSQQLRMRTLKMMRSQPTTLGCKQIWMLYQEGGSPIKTFHRTGTYVVSTDRAPVDTDWKDTTAQRNTQLLARNLWSMVIEDQMDARWARPATSFTPRCVKLHSEKENASMLTAS